MGGVQLAGRTGSDGDAHPDSGCKLPGISALTLFAARCRLLCRSGNGAAEEQSPAGKSGAAYFRDTWPRQSVQDTAGEIARRKVIATIIKNAPLAMINLLVQDDNGNLLLGLRRHPPARGYWFTPGDRILKNESIQQAVSRIAFHELGLDMDSVTACESAGVFEHVYPDNLTGAKGFGTHHIVIAQRLRLRSGRLPVLTGSSGQNFSFRWMSARDLSGAVDVHPNTKAYFAGLHRPAATAL